MTSFAQSSPHRFTSPGLVAVLVLSALAWAGEAAPESVTVAPKPSKMITPDHPAVLLEERISGEAEIEFLVGATGGVSEARVKSASRPEFGEAALAAVRQWEFEPGTRGGQPAAMRVTMPFAFTPPSKDPLEILLKRPVFVELDEPPVPAEKMPAWPMPKKLLEPAYPEELQGSGKRGKAVVSVIIDKRGRVMNPSIVKATFPEFEFSALAAAASLEFPPQLGPDKKPVNVSMDVQFDFRDEGRRARKKPEDSQEAGKKKK